MVFIVVMVDARQRMSSVVMATVSAATSSKKCKVPTLCQEMVGTACIAMETKFIAGSHGNVQENHVVGIFSFTGWGYWKNIQILPSFWGENINVDYNR